MLADGVAKDGPDGDSAFVVAERNQVLDTTNHGIAISAGHDCAIIANRIVSAGVLADGKPIAAQNVGAYIWDSYKAGDKRFYRNSGQDNLIGWVKGDERNDSWCPDAESWTGTTPWKGPITRGAYNGETRFWQQKLKSAGVTVGPNQAATTAPTSAPPK
jgi:hypothetical protein